MPPRVQTTLGLADVAQNPATSPLTLANIEESAAASGVGLGLAEAAPATEATAAPQAEQVVQAVPEIIPQSQEEAAPAQQEQQQETNPALTSQIPNFKEDPLGALGLIFSSTAAGIRGQPSPLAELRSLRIQEEKMRIENNRAVGQAVTKFLPSLSGKTKAQQTALIDAYANSFASDGGSAEFGNGVREALVSTVQALEDHAIPLDQAGPMGERYAQTLQLYVNQGWPDPVGKLLSDTSTKQKREQVQFAEDQMNLRPALADIATFAKVIDASVGTELDGRAALNVLLEPNGQIGGMPVITENELAALPGMMLKLGGDERAQELSGPEITAISNLGRNDVAELLGAVFIPAAENRARLDQIAQQDGTNKGPSAAEEEIQRNMKQFGLNEETATALAHNLIERDPVSGQLISLIPGKTVEDITAGISIGGGDNIPAGDPRPVVDEDPPAAPGKAEDIEAKQEVDLKAIEDRVSLVRPGLNVIEEVSGPFDRISAIIERVPVLSSLSTGEDRREAQVIFAALGTSFQTAFANNPRYTEGERKMIRSLISPTAGAFSTPTSIIADLKGARAFVVNKIDQEARVAADTSQSPEARKDAQMIATNGKMFIETLDDVINSAAPLIKDEEAWAALPPGTTYRTTANGKLYRKKETKN
jgi:hypothetical protein